MAKKYRITNCNATKVNIAIIGSSNYRTVAPGAELYLGELSDEKAAAYKKAYNCIGCVLSVIPENPVNKCIEERMPKKKGCCDTPTTMTTTSSNKDNPPTDDLIDVGEKINNQIVHDLEEEQQETQAQSTTTSAENTQVESTSEQPEVESHEESVVEAHSETEEGSKDITEEELNELTKAELKEMAESMGLEVDGRSSKAKIISMILENQ